MVDLLTVSKERKEAIERLALEFSAGRSVVLSTHINADGDGCGSEAALARILMSRGMNVSIEPIDVVREVCVYADRSDISEEIVRLRSHLAQFAQALQSAESAGRKLEFICQEMGRETNTIGSKANDAEISHEVVEIKTALERIREQIQNVE